ncbi:hypothetical protein ACTXT7_012372, partial [Hymenolepis weldensis]
GDIMKEQENNLKYYRNQQACYFKQLTPTILPGCARLANEMTGNLTINPYKLVSIFSNICQIK